MSRATNLISNLFKYPEKDMRQNEKIAEGTRNFLKCKRTRTWYPIFKVNDIPCYLYNKYGAKCRTVIYIIHWTIEHHLYRHDWSLFYLHPLKSNPCRQDNLKIKLPSQNPPLNQGNIKKKFPEKPGSGTADKMFTKEQCFKSRRCRTWDF